MNVLLRSKVVLQRMIAQIYALLTQRQSEQFISDAIRQLAPYKKGCIVIYAATIGELNAARSLIQYIKQQWPDRQLLICPGQAHYQKDYAQLYPDAILINLLKISPVTCDRLFQRIKPLFVIFIEGPSLHGYFPIRLNLTLPVQCLKDNIPLFVVNACLYKNYIASNIDRLEHLWFEDLHRLSITRWFVANECFAESLTKAHIPGERIVTVGDIKFDAIFASKLNPVTPEQQTILDYFAKSSCLLVAGSIKAPDEYQAIIQGWLTLKSQHPDARLILAPRYVQEKKMMEPIYHYLTTQGIHFSRRSQGIDSIARADLMVLDTFGELNYFYQIATFAFAGRNHGVLEPMRFAKPVIVGPEAGWDEGYPTSYYLYRYMLAQGALIQCDDYTSLGRLFIQLIKNPAQVQETIEIAQRTVKKQLGAVDKIIDNVRQQIK